MLVIHIGLPKTGTTFLQGMFRHTPELAFVHRKLGPDESRLCHDLRRFARMNALALPFYRRRIEAPLSALLEAAAPLPVLLSDEDISLTAGGFWRGTGAEPAPLARRLARLGRRLGPKAAPLRVIIGVRGQDQWLASRYAESSRMFPDFGQADFDARLARLAEGRPLAGPARWLDYRHVRDSFTRALGAENVLLLPLERLAESPGAALADLGRFLGGVEVAAHGAARQPSRQRNSLSIGDNVWRMRRDGTALRLDDALQAALRNRFAASNRAVSADLPAGAAAR